MPNVHHVKSWAQYFGPITTDQRTHDLRRNDRDYKVGDTMILEEFDPTTQKYTGQKCEVEITSMTSMSQPCAVSSEALDPAFCILSIRRVKSREASR
jgi:hypothetical protein